MKNVGCVVVNVGASSFSVGLFKLLPDMYGNVMFIVTRSVG